ncbi:metal tolerance protein B [Senna tora]|uniref:Metal tolerance protein B n=1 Tax=Senna tora TaxID=362788 RepID=A0A834SL58_9FABA|nr:metal tolerance protein B [Senna tora]
MEHEEAPVLEPRSMQQIEIPVASESLVLPMAMQSSCGSVCPFSQQEHSLLASQESSKSAKKLCGLVVFYTMVMLMEVVGGLKANSLAVMSDAAHLLSDITGFLISLFAVWASSWEPTAHQSFGYNRLEVLGALFSVQLIWLISGFFIYEAVGRLVHRNGRVNGMLMLAIAAFGFVLNLLMVVWLGHDHSHHHHHHHSDHHDHDDGCGDSELHNKTNEEKLNLVSSHPKEKNVLNINLQGAYLHVLADMIQSVGVMIAGAIIWAKPDWLVVDLMCTLIFSVISLGTTLSTLKNIYGILMERTPGEINVIELENGLKGMKGVQDIHDLHVWAITLGKIVLSCHVVAEPGITSTDLLNKIRHYCEKTHKIHHVTIQIE